MSDSALGLGFGVIFPWLNDSSPAMLDINKHACQKGSVSFTMMSVSQASALRVSDLMSANPACIHSTATPREFARLLLDRGVAEVPVVDSDERVIGVASKADLLQWCVKGGLGFGAGDLLVSLSEGGQGTRIDAVDLGSVADFMTSAPVTIRPSESLAEAARLMARHRLHRLIVVGDEGGLVGIMTSLDLLKPVLGSSFSGWLKEAL